jgi:adenylate kinase family enzyme
MGPSGAGKSTLARQLGGRLEIEVVHMDRLHWRPGWIEGPNEELRAAVAEVVEREAWVIDGNYGGSGTLEARMDACDTIVYLDFPRRVCLWRVFRRIVRYYGQTRPDLADDCPEKLDPEFIKWVWDTPKRRPAALERLATYVGRREIYILHNGREVRSFLAGVPAANAPANG